ncbi:acyl-CoA dehydrogenase family protein [Burkholderia multivorans]|uniref:acyl-CoA dehydrogenase family protein n=1 Tax=Burkholderia multivorans TaxID=87883 RepID=UPI001C239C47|nr:acyl-CoA dehydrogenase family protein [Burkholderia multivorans]MBU9221614.1 acyl-CoA dehydrogenase family protein [Burkholderia multivorans]MBU9417248.1 acyl-CoA dehydrogenase family protein [Burkholderia multivorans]MBU9475439.1 acyl-CoA dehydrogenase family protein [Burkholderia multivorans]
MSEVDQVKDEAFYAAFRQKIADYIEANVPAEVRAATRANRKLGRELLSRYTAAMAKGGLGYSAPGWTKEFGGPGWDVMQRLIFEEVTAAMDCPQLYHHGIGHIGPVIQAFGTDAQKARFLPPIIDGSEWWCQGYSEPGAGSDLASLKTSAVLDEAGEHYIVNGQKMWTSHAQEADIMYTLVRTSNAGKPQEGITLLLIPMNSPGIEVRPIHTIDQWHHVNEVFLNDVKVPVFNRIGAEGQGWSYGKFLLDRERLSPALTPRLLRHVQQVTELVRDKIREKGATPSLLKALDRLFEVEAGAYGTREILLSAIREDMAGTLQSSKSSALKMACSKQSQEVTSIAMDVLGPEYAARLLPLTMPEDELNLERNFVHTYLFYRSRTLAGGSTEVQKNIIAKSIMDAGYAVTTMFRGDLFDSSSRLAAAAETHQGNAVEGKASGKWRQALELGWQSVLVSEDNGGIGATLADLAGIVEAASRYPNVAPLVERCAVAPVLLEAAAAAPTVPPVLEQLLSGEASVSPVLQSHLGTPLQAATVSLEGKVLRGAVRGSNESEPATHLIFNASTPQGQALVLIERARLAERARFFGGIDGTVTADYVVDGLQVNEGDIVLTGTAANVAVNQALQIGALLTCVQIVGAVGAQVEQTIQYLNDRVQFGKPLAVHQVLRHNVVDCYVAYEGIKGQVARLIEAFEGSDDCAIDRLVILTKMFCAGVAREVGHAVIQMHGGMGMTVEMPATQLCMQSRTAAERFGNRSQCLDWLVAQA